MNEDILHGHVIDQRLSTVADFTLYVYLRVITHGDLLVLVIHLITYSGALLNHAIFIVLYKKLVRYMEKGFWIVRALIQPMALFKLVINNSN